MSIFHYYDKIPDISNLKRGKVILAHSWVVLVLGHLGRCQGHNTSWWEYMMEGGHSADDQ